MNIAVNVLIDIINNELNAASLRLIPENIMSEGMIIKPPHTPNNPVKVPTNAPIKKSIKLKS